MAVDDVQWLDAASASVLGVRASAACGGAGRDSHRAPQRRLGAGSARARARVSGGAAAAVAARPSERGRNASSAARAPRRLVSQAHASAASPAVGRESVLRARVRARARAVRRPRDSRVAHRACLRTARGVAGGRSRGTRAGRAAQRADHLHRRGSGLRPGDGARTPSRSAGRCDPGAGRRRARSFQPSAAGRAGRGGARPAAAAIAPSPSREARRRRRAARAAPRAGRGRAVHQGRRRARDCFGCRGLAWRNGGGRRAGRAFALAHADLGWRRRPPPPPAARRRPALRERGRGAVACDPRAARRAAATGC